MTMTDGNLGHGLGQA